MKRVMATAVILTALTAGVEAQVLNFPFAQGPWNQLAQKQQKVQRSVGMPPKDRMCGYWLMKKFGLNNRDLWRAYAWSGVGRPSNGSVGDIAVMKKSHVGYVSGHCAGGGISLTSYGNSRIGVYTTCYPRSAFKAFRRL
jgi:hypothetical protein